MIGAGRKIVLLLLAAAVIAFAGFRDAGYALLIAGGGVAGEASNGMVRLRCTYFTGSEKVITHIVRKSDDAGGVRSCPLVRKLAPVLAGADGD